MASDEQRQSAWSTLPQMKYREEGQEHRADGEGDGKTAWEKTDPELRAFAMKRAKVLDIPEDAKEEHPRGEYAVWLEELLWKLGRQMPEKQVGKRDFLMRANHDANLLKDLLKKLADSDYNVFEQVRDEPQVFWLDKRRQMAACCAVLPDLKYAGWVRMGMEKFETVFEGSLLK